MNKIVNLLQLAMAAGRTASGDALIPAIQSGKAKLAVYQEGAGKNRIKKIQDKCATYNVPVIALPETDFQAITRKSVTALVLTDAGFAQAVLKEWKG